MPEILRDRVMVEGRPAKASFNPTETFMRERRLLNATFMMGVAGKYGEQLTDTANASDTARHQMLMAARRFLSDARDADAGNPDSVGVWLGMGVSCEQAPNPDSRRRFRIA